MAFSVPVCIRVRQPRTEPPPKRDTPERLAPEPRQVRLACSGMPRPKGCPRRISGSASQSDNPKVNSKSLIGREVKDEPRDQCAENEPGLVHLRKSNLLTDGREVSSRDVSPDQDDGDEQDFMKFHLGTLR